ncbi:unnamed protein product [Toxocara canis]|uniref:Uncharacterized protein n=1 Tax=Toxocara canis TaxID=6265 RepID=A0A183UB90_TOXCA|nr:unnamed protein product [Toxocara canis]
MMMPQSAVIRARYVPDVRGVNRYKHFYSPLVTETNEAGENIDKRGSPYELPYLDTGDLTRYAGRLDSDVTFTISDDNYLDTKSGLSSRQRLSVGLLQINALANTSHSLSLSSSLPVLASASKPNSSLKPLSKRPNGLNRSTQNIYTGTSVCKLNSNWPSSSARTVQMPKVEEKKLHDLNCGRAQRNDDRFPKGDTGTGRETSCQRKDAVFLVDCAAGADETYSTKTLGTQTSVLEEKAKEASATEPSTCKATQTQAPVSTLTRAIQEYDAEASF